ncbi:MAG: putative nickel transporter [Capsulimonas sp.]|nr:putative nickel transporter [Capsulimonas sp.]
MNFRRFMTTAISAALLTAAVLTTPAGAHPMGNFSISHYSRITAADAGMQIFYVLDMAEIPTVAERAAMDTNSDGKISSAEQGVYLQIKAPELAQGLSLTADGKLVTLDVVDSKLAFRPGAGGLDTIRLVINLKSPTSLAAGAHAIAYKDGNYAERTGWKEIVAAAGSRAYLGGSSVPARDRTKELTAYPSVTAMSPLQETSATFTVSDAPLGAMTAASVAPAPTTGSASAAATNGSTPQDRFTQTIAAKNLTPGVMLLGLLVAFVFGSFHALSPGHGKTMVAAYLVGTRGTVKHAFLLGVVVTITHTLGVFALGLITLFASQYIVPEKLFPILSVISGLAVFGVGLWLFYSRIRGLDTGHSHGHGHSHDHDHTHDLEHTHEHAHAPVLAMAAVGDHTHDHDHPHDHSHDHGHTHDDAHSHDHDHGHSHSHNGGHSHGFGHHHHHHVPDGPITAKSLIALGISGGIVPCPSALVVLLSAIALHRVAYGLLLITSFSIGLAAVLIAIGVAVVSASKLLERVPRSDAFTRFMPIFSAAAVTTIGVVLIIRAVGGAAI